MKNKFAQVYSPKQVNLSTSFHKLSAQSIQTKKLHQNWVKNTNSIFFPNIQSFSILAPFLNKRAIFFYGQLLTHKDDHFFLNCIKG
jgi:hypothetical protein